MFAVVCEYVSQVFVVDDIVAVDVTICTMLWIAWTRSIDSQQLTKIQILNPEVAINISWNSN